MKKNISIDWNVKMQEQNQMDGPEILCAWTTSTRLEDAQLTKLLVPGTDEEDEESYRMRIEDSFGIKPFAGKQSILQRRSRSDRWSWWRKRHTGEKAAVYQLLSYQMNTEKHQKELIDSVQTQVDPVQNHGEGIGIAPIGHAVIISTVNEYTVNVSAVATYDTGYSSRRFENAD